MLHDPSQALPWVALGRVRTERQGRMVGNATNALASSIVLVMPGPSTPTRPMATRGEFVDALKVGAARGAAYDAGRQHRAR